MIKSEDLKCNEDVLWIWGFKFPKEKNEAKELIHHTLLLISSLSTKEKFRIVYFHSEVSGSGSNIPKLIKKIWKKMSKEMRTKLSSFDIVHPNFSLKWALFFFDKFSLTDYKIHFRSKLESLFEKTEIEQKTFILGCLPVEIKLWDDAKSGEEGSTAVIGHKKSFKKDVVSSSDSKYKDFDTSKAIQTYDIWGKHLYEFPKTEDEAIPEVFTVLFNYFERNPSHMKVEGIFRLAGNKELLKEIEGEVYQGNYFYLGNVEDPLTVGVLLKRILREMGEPLWTFEYYTRFKDINDETWTWPEEKVQKAYELVEKLPEVNRETFKALLGFLRNIAQYEVDNKMRANNLAIVFAPNLFKAYEVTPNDMIYAQVLVKTLTLMISNFDQYDNILNN